MIEKQSKNIKTSRNTSHLDAEVVSLFGREMVEQSKRVSMDAMAIEAELVAEGARQLRELIGQPDRQQAIIKAMDDETALALCKWIREPGYMKLFISQGVH